MRKATAGPHEHQHEARLNCSDARGPSSASSASSSSSPGASNLPALPLSLLARSSFLVLSARQGPAGPAASAAPLFCLGRAPCKQAKLSLRNDRDWSWAPSQHRPYVRTDMTAQTPQASAGRPT